MAIAKPHSNALTANSEIVETESYRQLVKLSPERGALTAQQLVDEIYRIKLLGNAPQVSVEVQDLGGGEFRINWSIPLNQLPVLEAEILLSAKRTDEFQASL